MSAIPNIPRRVVTGIKNGKSVILEDAQVTNVKEHFPSLIISDVWATDTMPVDLTREVPVENTPFPQILPNGSYMRYVSIPPDSTLVVPPLEPGQLHPLMHQTDTLDYILIVAGELYLIMEEGETLLKAGDIVIQRGTNHAWSNRSDKPCIQFAVLLQANV